MDGAGRWLMGSECGSTGNVVPLNTLWHNTALCWTPRKPTVLNVHTKAEVTWDNDCVDIQVHTPSTMMLQRM